MYYFLYFLAFASTTVLQLPTLWVIPVVVYAVAFYLYLRPGLAEFTYPGIVYVVLAVLMSWQALEALDQSRSMWALFGVIAVFFFFVSDTVRGIDRFRRPVHNGTIFVLGTLYLAQWSIVLSLWAPLGFGGA